MNFPPHDDPSIQEACISLLQLFDFAKARRRTTTRTLFLVSVSDLTDETGQPISMALLAGDDDTGTRDAAVDAIREIPRTALN